MQPREVPPDLDVIHEPGFLGEEERSALWTYLTGDELLWNRPQYRSERFGKLCDTPCWTTVQGGLEGANHYTAMAPVLLQLKTRLEERLGTTFNVVLLRLYFGADTIAYHTDAREFLGKNCTVASISLGETRRFDMKRVEVGCICCCAYCCWLLLLTYVAPKGDLWPTIGKGDGEQEPVSKKARGQDVISFQLADGDLFVMQGETQQKWLHAVAPQLRVTKPRFNINFRRIIFSAGQDVALRGHDTYYKYCVTGDLEGDAWKGKAKTFSQIKPVTIADFFGGKKKGE